MHSIFFCAFSGGTLMNCGLQPKALVYTENLEYNKTSVILQK